MAINVSCHLRRDGSPTNFRAEAVASGLQAAGCKVTYRHRIATPPADTDIVLQTGFGRTTALVHAIAEALPYLIAELPPYRTMSDSLTEWVSFGYGGLMGGAWHPKAPQEEVWRPELQPMKTEGPTVLFAQKSNDHSLRDRSHDDWLATKLDQWPEAEFRPHPIMTTRKFTMEPIEDCLKRCYRAITYTSTVGAEALIAGCVSKPQHEGSSAYRVSDREAWLHQLSWTAFPVEIMATARVGQHILSGYEIARIRAANWQQEVPKPKWTCGTHYHIDDPRVEAMK